MIRVKVGFTILLATALVLSSFPSSALAGSWSTPVNISENGLAAQDVQLAVHSDGLVTAVWLRRDIDNKSRVQSSTSLSGGPWTTPENISLAGGQAEAPQIVVDSNGRATAVWSRHDGSNPIIQASTRPNGGTWSTPVNLSLVGYSSYDPQLTVDATGLVFAVWERELGALKVVESSISLNGGPWSPHSTLSGAGNSYNPQVVVDSTGRATAIWEGFVGSDDAIISSTRPSGGPWSSAVPVSEPGGNVSPPQLAVAPDGTVTAVWGRNNGVDEILQSSTSLNGGPWSAPVNVSALDDDTGGAQVIVDNNGRATAVWESNSFDDAFVKSSTRQSGGTWSTPVALSPEHGYDPQLTVDGNGLVTVVWEGDDGVDRPGPQTRQVAQSSTSLNGGSWSLAVWVSSTSDLDLDVDDPQVIVDTNGLVTAAWERDEAVSARRNIIQSNTFRESTTLTAPTAATTTTPKLATTGANVEWLFVAGLTAVIAGAGFLTVSRRKRTA